MATPDLLIEAATRNSVLLEGYKQSEIDKLEPFIRRIDAELRERLSRDDLTTYSRARLEELIALIDSLLAAIFGEFTEQLQLDLFALAEYEAGFEAVSLNQVLVNAEALVPTLDAIRTAVRTQPLSVTGPDGGKLLTPFIEDWTRAERNRVAGAIRMGYVQGETNQQIIQRLRGTKAQRYNDGILAITQRNAQAVVATAVQHVAMTGRLETIKANRELTTGYRWISTLDGRTTPVCRSLDGRVFKTGKGPLPPIHIRCRSSIAPEINEKYKFLDEDATRASKDGQVDANLTYYEWLKRQPAAFQDVVLGPVRARLFRDGGLSAERFAALQLDRQFKPLTLEEMKALEPLAFAKAGID